MQQNQRALIREFQALAVYQMVVLDSGLAAQVVDLLFLVSASFLCSPLQRLCRHRVSPPRLNRSLISRCKALSISVGVQVKSRFQLYL